MLTRFEFNVEESVRRNRLDKFLFEKVTAVSKIYLLNRLKEGKCTVNGIIKPAGYHLQANDAVSIKLDLNAATGMQPEDIALEIIYEDEEIIVVNKPAGLLVHPTLGQKNGTLLNALSYYFNREQFRQIDKTDVINDLPTPAGSFVRPGLIHRLDRQTSGLMVLSKTSRALRVLNSHFQRKLVEKKYVARVEGVIKNDYGVIDAPIGHFEELKKWDIKADGKSAETRYRVLERSAVETLLELEPVTGRTHQLRIHCTHIGHPIVGDDVHAGRSFIRLCLHAAALSFWHPNGSRRLQFYQVPPAEFNLS